MIIPEDERSRLSKEPFTVTCPQCWKFIKTEYSLWDIQVLAEQRDSMISITCPSRKFSFVYNTRGYKQKK